MFRIVKRWTFDAAHQLNGLPAGHKCGQLHGHTYTVELELEAETLDPHGFVVDFGDLAPVKQLIDTVYDHRFLNEVLPVGVNPTAETLASVLCAKIIALYEMRKHLVGDEPVDFELITGNGEPVTLHQVVPLRDGVQITAVRVSETGSSWAEIRR